MQRDVVRELRHGDVREQRRTRDATIDRSTRCRGLYDAIAACAGQLRTAVADHAEVRPDVFELFRDVFAQQFELAAAIGAVIVRGQMDALFALKVIGQRLAAHTFATRPFQRRSGGHIGRAFIGL